jgi:galactokinase
MVKMAQTAEHDYVGVQCGIMDQFASMMGKKDHVIKLDCKTLDYEYVPFKLDGYKNCPVQYQCETLFGVI